MALEVMAMQNVESSIREKFDDRGVRIFRLLRQKGHLEEEQVRTDLSRHLITVAGLPNRM